MQPHNLYVTVKKSFFNISINININIFDSARFLNSNLRLVG